MASEIITNGISPKQLVYTFFNSRLASYFAPLSPSWFFSLTHLTFHFRTLFYPPNPYISFPPCLPFLPPSLPSFFLPFFLLCFSWLLKVVHIFLNTLTGLPLCSIIIILWYCVTQFMLPILHTVSSLKRNSIFVLLGNIRIFYLPNRMFSIYVGLNVGWARVWRSLSHIIEILELYCMPTKQ